MFVIIITYMDTHRRKQTHCSSNWQNPKFKSFLEHFLFPFELYGFKPYVLFIFYGVSPLPNVQKSRVELSNVMAGAYLPQYYDKCSLEA